jgi:predicted amidohydrolase
VARDGFRATHVAKESSLDFRSASIEFIRKKAAQVQGAEGFEIVELAAYLFAIATKLAVLESSARMFAFTRAAFHPGKEGEPAPNLEDLKSALDYLCHLQDSLSSTELYLCLTRTLVTIDGEVSEPSDKFALPPFTELAEFPQGVTGRVHHWLRPPSKLARLREKRFQFEGDRSKKAPSRPPRPQDYPENHLRSLVMYWETGSLNPSVLPVTGRSVVTVPAFGAIRQRRVKLEKLASRWFRLNEDQDSPRPEDYELRIALCPLPVASHPVFRIYNLMHPVQGEADDSQNLSFFSASNGPGASPIAGRGELDRHLKELLAVAEANDIHLIVCPELTLDPQAREVIRTLLLQTDRESASQSRLGFVAGSFHVWTETGGDASRPPVNESIFLGRFGAELMRHRKRGPFRFHSKLAEKAPHLFCEQPDELSREVQEDISYGAELQILETRIGRLALLICADVIAPDHRGYVPILRQLRPDLVLVVAMSGETEPFVDFAREMARHWIGTLFVNAHCLFEQDLATWTERMWQEGLGPAEERDRTPLLAASDLALQENPGQPPTLARWRVGAPEPEVFFFRPTSGDRGWRRLSGSPVETGVRWLTDDGGRPIGLVLDLASHGRSNSESESLAG